MEKYLSLNGLRSFACIGIVMMHVAANSSTRPTKIIITSNIIDYAGEFVLLFLMVSALSCGRRLPISP